jgi:hypothetical protein
LAQTPPPSIGDSAPAPKPDAAIDQDTFNKVVSREKAQAASAERKRILEEAGVGSLDQLRATIKAYSEAQDAAKSEVQKAVEAANTEMEAARSERQAVARERHTLNVEKALAASGARDNLSDLAKLVDVEVGADPAAVEAAVEAVKTKFSALFGYTTPPASEPSGGGPAARPSNAQDALSKGADRAKSYNDGTHVPNF